MCKKKYIRLDIIKDYSDTHIFYSRIDRYSNRYFINKLYADSSDNSRFSCVNKHLCLNCI